MVSPVHNGKGQKMEQARSGAPAELSTDERLRAGDLIAELRGQATAIGPNLTSWPGLTVYRFEAPSGPQWSEVHSLALCVVAQGRKAVTAGEATYRYDPFNYLVLHRGMRFQSEILEASIELPFLSLVLQIDPALVQRVATDMREGTAAAFRRPATAALSGPRWSAGGRAPLPAPVAAAGHPAAPGRVSPLDSNTCGAVLRFLRAARTGPDRRVLAPMYLQEIVYRVLRAGQRQLLLEAAACESEANPVNEVIAYVRGHLAEPLSVADLAERACLSPSAFAHLFRDVSGMSPYQFIKSLRLDQARELLVTGDLNVSEVARAVGYSSLSHFINEFKRHFGVTPRAYADAQRAVVPLRLGAATSRPADG
jgi:AraC-like DNA-binding protein